MQHSPFSNLKNPLMQLINLHTQTTTKLMTELPLHHFISPVFLTSSLSINPASTSFLPHLPLFLSPPFARPSYPIPLLCLHPFISVSMLLSPPVLTRSNSQIAFMKRRSNVFGSIGWLQRLVKSPSTT